MFDSDGRLREAPGLLGERDGQKDYPKNIELDFDPQLDGETTVRTEDGRVRVRTVWAELRDELDDRDPEAVHDETGVSEETYQRVVHEFAEADKAKIIQGKGVNDWYHNDLGNRALQLLVMLMGNLGERGTGLNHYAGQEEIWTFHSWKSLSFPTGNVRGMSATLWTYYHVGILDNTDADTAAKIRESIDERWMPVYLEEHGDGFRPDPTIMLAWYGNYFSQTKRNVAVEEELWPKLDLVVDTNFRVDPTALYSDIVLSTMSHHEKHDLSMTDMHSYVHPFMPVVEPLGESKTDWQVFRELAAEIQEVATERGVGPISDRKFDRDIDLQSVYDDCVRDWETGEADAFDEDRVVCEYILKHFKESNPPESDDQVTLADTVEQPQRLLAASDHWTSDIEDRAAYTPWKDFVQDKNPWPTVTGRQQYYIDHDWFFELGEQLPTHKEGPMRTSDDYPMEYNTPHGR